tara:strand:- start:228 stop:656 length:429 start_codon:yes stop_codon:yes gene_type:complete
MRASNPIIALCVVAGFVACDRGSVSNTPVAQCFPSGKCSEEMLERGFSAETGDLASGAKVYEANCATCHGPRGEGSAKSGNVDMTTAAWQKKMSDTGIANVIRSGRMPQMPGFALPKKDLQDLVKYVRSLEKTNSAAKTGGY